jgi:hypothetical protein
LREALHSQGFAALNLLAPSLIRLLPAFLLLLVLTGCQAPAPSATVSTAASQPTHTAVPLPTASVEPEPQTAQPTEPSEPHTATPAPTPSPAPTASLPQVQIFYQDYAQVEILAPEPCRVLIDVMDPGKLTAPATGSDVLLTTHGHFDHLNQAFADSFPGEQLRIKAGQIVRPGCTITGIASAHNAGDAFFQSGGTNYIFLVETAGLRIAHFGDIGQERLTDLQLEQLGQLDVAIIQLANRFSDMNAQNEKAFGLIDQLQPALIVPTHLDASTLSLAVERYPSWYLLGAPLDLFRSFQFDEPNLLLLGSHAVEFGSPLDLTRWPMP